MRRSGSTRAAADGGDPGGDLVHARDRRPASERPGPRRRDRARWTRQTDSGPAYYGINCAHPTHFDAVLDPGADWAQRIAWLRANASTLSHAELDEAEELDEGDPADLGARYATLEREAPAAQRGRRLLRHRPPPRDGDREGLAAGS